jgi:hypothetical protein
MRNKKEAVAALLLYGASRNIIGTEHIEEMMKIDWFREVNSNFGIYGVEGLRCLSNRLNLFGMSMCRLVIFKILHSCFKSVIYIIIYFYSLFHFDMSKLTRI